MNQTATATVRRTAWTLAALVLVGAGLGGAGLGGCAARHEQFVLDVAPTTGAIGVDIENFRGSVEVRVDPKQPTILVESTVRSDEGFDEDAAARHHDAVSVTADMDEAGARGVLRVRTATALPEDEDHSVDLFITMPRVDGVRVVNKGGEVVIVDGAGAVQITNTGGAVEYRTRQPIVDPVTITTADGNIYYQVPPESSGLFDLETLKGRVSYKDNDGQTDEASATARRLTARLNAGANPVLARTSAGDIIVRVDEESFNTTRAFRVTPPDITESFFLDSTRRYTRNLPDDAPELQKPQTVSARYLWEQ
ncbi:MAG TPA: hypothetical protein DEB06_03850 [Phycisphaerales bacterium]|nr:hypothetical protein [Phycisphaerales bacterium]